MIKNNEIYLCRPWNYIERKDDKILLLWSDIPTWMVVDDELFLLLRSFNGKNTIDRINSIFSRLSHPTKTGQIEQMLSILIEARVVYKKGEKELLSKKQDYKIHNVIVHPTNGCNLNCKMCYNKQNRTSKKDEIGIEEIKHFLDQVKEFSSDKAVFSIAGGEPLLETNKTLEIAKYAKEKGFATVGMSTNGTLITREFAKKAKEIGLDVQVSIDGTNEEENSYLRGKNVFKRACDGIRILKEEGVFTVTNFVCYKGNYRSLGGYYKLVSDLGVDHARFGLMRRMGGGQNKEIETVPADELLRYAYDLFENHPEYKRLLGTDYFSAFANTCRLNIKYDYCGAGLITVLLNSDGSVYPCTGHVLPKFKAGDMREKSFSDIWQHSPILKKIRETYPMDKINEKCSKCMVRYWCLGGCRAEAYRCTHKMNSPAIECDNIKKAVIEMIWLLSTTPGLGIGKTYSFD